MAMRYKKIFLATSLLITTSLSVSSFAMNAEELNKAEQIKSCTNLAAEFVDSSASLDVAIEGLKKLENHFVYCEKEPSSYLFALGFDGKFLYHAGFSALNVGGNISDQTSDTQLIAYAIVGLARTNKEGWVDYTYKNPETHAMECKSTYVESTNKDALVAYGYYHAFDADGKCSSPKA